MKRHFFYGSLMIKKHLKSFVAPKVVLVLMLSGFLCSVLLSIFFYQKWSEYEELEQTISELQYKKQISERAEKRKNKYYSEIEKSDRFYIQNHLEPFLPLSAEIKEIENLLVYQKEDLSLQNRVHFLKNASNRLRFEEKKSEKFENIEEVELHQISKIEVDLNDIKQLLCLIEGVSIGPYTSRHDKPQLIIKELILERKGKEDKQTYLIEMDLIQRGNLRR